MSTMFGTATLSFADGIKTQAGDIFEIEVPDFGQPLRNTLLASRRRPKARPHVHRPVRDQP